jgi:hypothetical protein
MWRKALGRDGAAGYRARSLCVTDPRRGSQDQPHHRRYALLYPVDTDLAFACTDPCHFLRRADGFFLYCGPCTAICSLPIRLRGLHPERPCHGRTGELRDRHNGHLRNRLRPHQSVRLNAVSIAYSCTASSN